MWDLIEAKSNEEEHHLTHSPMKAFNIVQIIKINLIMMKMNRLRNLFLK